MSDINEDLIDLQTRIAYQEDTIAQLNLIVTKQDGEILQLQKQMSVLAKRLDELLYVQEQGGGDDVVNERPPHY
jgi:SlyX protein